MEYSTPSRRSILLLVISVPITPLFITPEVQLFIFLVIAYLKLGLLSKFVLILLTFNHKSILITLSPVVVEDVVIVLCIAYSGSIQSVGASIRSLLVICPPASALQLKSGVTVKTTFVA